MKAETEIIAVSSTGRAVIMYVKIFKTEIFIKSHNAVDNTLTDNLQNQSVS